MTPDTPSHNRLHVNYDSARKPKLTTTDRADRPVTDHRHSRLSLWLSGVSGGFTPLHLQRLEADLDPLAPTAGGLDVDQLHLAVILLHLRAQQTSGLLGVQLSLSLGVDAMLQGGYDKYLRVCPDPEPESLPPATLAALRHYCGQAGGICQLAFARAFGDWLHDNAVRTLAIGGVIDVTGSV
jgi:hypothetical protein